MRFGRENPHALSAYRARNIVANPNCSTMQMLVALAPIQRAVGIERINVATYQSVSGAGRGGIEELTRQRAAQGRPYLEFLRVPTLNELGASRKRATHPGRRRS